MTPNAAPTADPAATLERWRAEEAAVRARVRGDWAPLPPDRLVGRTGLEQLRAMLDGELPAAPIGRTLDFILVEVGPGHAVFQGRPGRAHYNPLGSVHGGWFATLLDSALGCAVHSAMPADKAYTTLELKVNLVRALTDRVPLVRAEGRTVHVGGQTATAEARLVGPDGRLYAHGTTTCLVFPRPAG